MVCDLCIHQCSERDLEKLIHDHCDICPIEAELQILATKAHLQGQLLTARRIAAGIRLEHWR